MPRDCRPLAWGGWWWVKMGWKLKTKDRGRGTAAGMAWRIGVALKGEINFLGRYRPRQRLPKTFSIK